MEPNSGALHIKYFTLDLTVKPLPLASVRLGPSSVKAPLRCSVYTKKAKCLRHLGVMLRTEFPTELPVILQRAASPWSDYGQEGAVADGMLRMLRPGGEVNLPVRPLELGEGWFYPRHGVHF